MRNNMLNKGIIFGIILLLITISTAPITGEAKLLLDKTLLDDWIDQENSDWNGAGLGFDGKISVAQSFIPKYKILTRVELIVWNEGDPHGNLTVSIRENLNDTDLTSVTIPVEELPQQFYPQVNWTEFDFPDINITTKKTYYIVWTLDIAENPGPQPYNVTYWGVTQDDNYTRGEQWYSIDNNWHSANPGWDFCFKVYVYDNLDNGFLLLFGIITVDAKMTFVEKDNSSFFPYYYYFSDDVENVTIIGFGFLFHSNDTKLHPRFYMKTFTDVTMLAGFTYRKLMVSEESQHLTLITLTRRYLSLIVFST
ncbi:MAG: hypothetical protein JW840_09170 [Candidatus Thermoplasmatota archaeon]|nr:hypothetical protein [Candidatus Thermoplasmatota archaeon]